MKRKPTTAQFDDEVVFCLEHQIIPAWELYGMDRLAVHAETLTEDSRYE